MRFEVLDHGYVEFIESWGHGRPGIEKSVEVEEGIYDLAIDQEAGIIEAARQSTQGSFRGWDQDAKLLKYLYDNKHATPFEFAGMVIEVQAPIFVFREWHRHRTQSYNEMSARYSPLPDLYYVPSTERLSIGAGKQGGANTSTETDRIFFENDLIRVYEEAETAYQNALRNGIPKELARLVMPVGHYSKMRASANLRNWLSFLTLRCDPAAQWEIRQYAEAVSQIISKIFPRTHALWAQSIYP